MITPRFRLNQTPETVTIIVRAPYCNLRSLELIVEENVFIFLCSPYYLRLNLPGKITETSFTNSKFNADSGEFEFTFEKVISGEHFPDLDLITKLLSPKIEVKENNRIITILTNVTESQQLTSTDLNQDFGFALAGRKDFRNVCSEFVDVFEIDPLKVNLKERRKLRLENEQAKFNTDHYLCDYIENEEILEIMSEEAPWCKLNDVDFTDLELDFLKDLPNIDYKLSSDQALYAKCCLIDILYAYCYDRRTTQFEGNSESGWTIIKLAATFSWLDAFKEPREALISGFRRSLIYPLYRNFDLSLVILEDLKEMLKLDEKYIIRCLIEIYHIFLKGDCCRYILNNLFIKDYIVYIMKWEKSEWKVIIENVCRTKITKSDLGLNLCEIEESVCGNSLNFNGLQIKDNDSDDDDTSNHLEES